MVSVGQAVWNKSNTLICLDFHPDQTSARCCVIEGSLYVVAKDHHGHYIHHCDRDALPYDSSPGNADAPFTADTLEVLTRDPSSTSEIDISLSPAGLSATDLLFPAQFDYPVTTSIQFLPAMYENSPIDSSPLVFDRVAVHLTVNGSPFSRPDMAASQSGACMVSACHPDPFEEEQTIRFHLIRYRKDPAAIDARILELPSFITLGEAPSLAIDDHRGVVFLLVEEYLFALPYA
jgi:hypothetical protein